MLFLGVLVFSIVFVGILSKKLPQLSWLKIVIIVLVNLLVVEVFCYGYFLFLVFSDNSLPLIGRQKTLDHLIKQRLVSALYLGDSHSNNFYQIDQDLGYTVARDKSAFMYRTNNQGMRANREYSLIPPDNKLRVATIGDSFVFCDWEKNEYTWQHFLEKSVKNLEVLNFGVSGYGLSQSYLRYLKDVIKFKPDVIFVNYVLLGNRDFTSPEDISLSGEKLTRSTLYRPYLSLRNGTLTSKAINPIDFFNPKLRKAFNLDPLQLNQRPSFWSWSIFDVSNALMLVRQIVALNNPIKDPAQDSDKLKLLMNLKLLKDFFAIAKNEGSTILFFSNTAFNDLPNQVKLLIGKHRNQLVFIDGEEALNKQFKLRGAKKEELLNSTNHYNAQGNVYYAETVAILLQSRPYWGEGNRRFRFDLPTSSFKRLTR